MGLAAGPLPSLVRAASVNSRLQHASIGVGGMGWGDLQQIASHPEVEVIAICDVDTARMEQAAQLLPEARRYQDWRELLDEEGDRIDSVNIATPDHMHAPIALGAMGLGKHVYCQKPLTHDLHEARQVTLAAADARVVTQMGIQLSSGLGDRMTVRLVRDNAIGRVSQVYLWSNKDPWRYRPTGPRPDHEDPIPATLD
jgi:predicted dehydrogenase